MTDDLDALMPVPAWLADAVICGCNAAPMQADDQDQPENTSNPKEAEHGNAHQLHQRNPSPVV